jgi:hypothetical protein
MKVNPSYLDDELVIAFTFQFQLSQNKIGEAVVFTYPELSSSNEEKELYYNDRTMLKNNKFAILKEFNVIKEYEKDSMAKLLYFLKVIGIKPYENTIKQAVI